MALRPTQSLRIDIDMSLLDRLTGGDLRSIGDSEQVAADAAEKATAARPDLLQPFKSK